MLKIKNWLITYKKQLFMIGFILLLGIAFFLRPKQTKTSVIVEEKQEPMIEETKKEDISHSIRVDIKGAVKNPGVYEMRENSRVIDVIFEAGGLLEDANTSRINLSKKIKDEMTIIIYHQSEIDALKETQTESIYIEPECSCPDSMNDACVAIESSDTLENTNLKISLNQATLEELQTLSGIGLSKAQAIINYREEHPFQTIEELKEIKGIGDSIFEKIKDSITV